MPTAGTGVANAPSTAPASATATPSADCAAETASFTTTPPTLGTSVAPGSASVRDVRYGAHPCYDRLVFDLTGPTRAGYDVHYVDAVRSQGQGAAVPVRGTALQVVLRVATDPSWSVEVGQSPVGALPASAVVSQVSFAGSFEGYTSFAVGIRSRLPIRVTNEPGQVIVDVARS